jgi:F-type H+-transporting ATPase subunit delta
MLPNPRLAARYAKSILGFSIEKGQLEAVYQDMLFLQVVCRESREFVNLLRSPVIKEEKKAQILVAVIGGKVSDLTRSFFRLLLLKDREASLPEIISAFIAQYKEYKGIQTATLTTATPIGDPLKQEILERIKKAIPAKQIELNTEVREDLIGGFILQIGDRLLDGSIAFELKHVQQQFENNDFIYKIR